MQLDPRRVARDFSDRVRDADIPVVFYAGHGIGLTSSEDADLRFAVATAHGSFWHITSVYRVTAPGYAQGEPPQARIMPLDVHQFSGHYP